jgi:hypothetical protein
MKKIILIITLIILIGLTGFSQGELDALRYSQRFSGGTARSLSMGGAFGALGGDFSSLSINPGGIGVFRSTEISITPTLLYDINSSNFIGNTNEDFIYNFNINNIGLITSYNTNRTEGWVSLNLGVGYNRLNNFSRNIIIEGVNTSSSMMDYFANMADGNPIDQLYLFEEDLAWQTWLIDTVTGQPTEYETVLSEYGDKTNSTYGQVQRRTVNYEGSIGEFLFSFGANYSHKLYLGATFGIQKVRYTERTKHKESDPNNEIWDFDYFVFDQWLETRGTGYTFKIGAIYKPIDMLRIGGAIHLPTFFTLEDDYLTRMESGFDDGYIYNEDSPDLLYLYELNTPFRTVGSLALQLKKNALLSFDYEYVDYSKARLRKGEDQYDFEDENDAIMEAYKPAHNLRAGIEYRFGQLALRGGYAFYGSPYSSSEINKDASYSSVSGGIGIREENFFIDLACVFTNHDEKYFMYQHSGLEAANNSSNTSKFLATFGFRF